MLGVVLVLISNFFERPNTALEYRWAGCENLGKCSLPGYSDPPLLILGFDGFSREYLNKKIVKSLDLLAECGVKADRVFPAFPTKTIPNQYTIVTGLYPESHGVADNSVFDPELSQKLMSMREPGSDPFFGGEPIWAAYKRLTGKPAHCLFWTGCYNNNTGYKPDVAPDYNEAVPFQERMDTLVMWLNLREEKRPGLITAYFHQPDYNGHYLENMDESLIEVDQQLDYLLTALHKDNLLECINLVFLSDHGMQPLNKKVDVKDYVNMDGLILVNGSVARLYLNGTKRTVDEVASEIKYKVDGVKVNTRRDIPLRKHYSRSGRVGDLIIEGNPGTAFFNFTEVFKVGDHGSDYLIENLHAVMVARGPSFCKNVTVRPYQLVQYMNLWLSLFGLEGAVPNNGTIGFFDSTLKNPPKRRNNGNLIKPCKSYQMDTKMCPSGTRLETLPIILKNHCFTAICGPGGYNAIVANTTDTSQHAYIHGTELLSIGFIDSSKKHQRHKSTKNVHPGSDVISLLISKEIEYSKRFGKLFVIWGNAQNGGANDENTMKPQIYAIMITCTGKWKSSNPPVCEKFDEMKSIAFSFPATNANAAKNWTNVDDLFLEYSATIQDIEGIAGFKLEIDALTPQENIWLRTHVTFSLW